MKLINDYEGASIKIDKIDEINNVAYTSVNDYYYNFTVKNENDVATIHIKDFEKSSYFDSENIPIPYIRNVGDTKWNKINKEYFDCSNPQDLIIKVPESKEIEISLFPRYNKQDLDNFLETVKDKVEVVEDVLTKIIIGDRNLPATVIIARQHPGETLSSFFVEGIITELLENKQKYTEKNCYIIFPIVNTGGVKNGNHRLTNGVDYNRSWDLENAPKEIKYIKNEMKNINLQLFIDVHCDEITPQDYLRTNKKMEQKEIAGIQVLEDMGKLRRFARALIKQHKIIKLSKQTAREYVSQKYKCENMLIEMSLKESPELAMKKGKNFIKEIGK